MVKPHQKTFIKRSSSRNKFCKIRSIENSAPIIVQIFKSDLKRIILTTALLNKTLKKKDFGKLRSFSLQKKLKPVITILKTKKSKSFLITITKQ